MSRLERIGLWAGVAAPLLYVLTVVAGGFAVPDYSHLADPISALTAAGRSGVRWIEGAFALYNVLLLGFAASGLTSIDRTWRPVFMLLSVIGALGLLMWPFPMDLPGTPISIRGAVHIELAVLASLLTLIAVLLSVLNWHREGRTALRGFCAACLALMAAGGAAAALAAAQGWQGVGLFERVTIGVFELWLLMLAATFIRGGTSLASARWAQ